MTVTPLDVSARVFEGGFCAYDRTQITALLWQLTARQNTWKCYGFMKTEPHWQHSLQSRIVMLFLGMLIKINRFSIFYNLVSNYMKKIFLANFFYQQFQTLLYFPLGDIFWLPTVQHFTIIYFSKFVLSLLVTDWYRSIISNAIIENKIHANQSNRKLQGI